MTCNEIRSCFERQEPVAGRGDLAAAVASHLRACPSCGPEFQAQLELLGNYIGKPVFFGIRPEDIHDSSFVPRGTNEAAKFSANVTVVEPLGSEVFAYVENGGKEMVSRLDPRTSARVGQPIDLVIDMGKMHLFDRETEKALV